MADGATQPDNNTLKNVVEQLNKVEKGYLVIGFGLGILVVAGLTLAICVKLYCCQDKRKFRSSKETKCVRHQQCMTSPLDSPTRSIISTGARAIGVDTKDGPLPSAPLLAHSMASLQRANSNSSVNQTEDDSSFREQTVIAPSTERLLKRQGEVITSSTLPKPSKRTTSLRKKFEDSASISSTGLIETSRLDNNNTAISMSHDELVPGTSCQTGPVSGNSGRIVARLTECPSKAASRTSVATVEEYKRPYTATNSSPVKPVRNRRKSGTSGNTGSLVSTGQNSNTESIPLLVQSRATVHASSNHDTSRSRLRKPVSPGNGFSQNSVAPAPKGNVDEVALDSHIPGQDELHGNIVKIAPSSAQSVSPPAYSSRDAAQYLSPSALFSSSNCVGDQPSSQSKTPALLNSATTAPSTPTKNQRTNQNPPKMQKRSNNTHAFNSVEKGRHLSTGSVPSQPKDRRKKPHVSASDYDESSLGGPEEGGPPNTRVYPRMWFVSLDNITPEPLARNATNS